MTDVALAQTFSRRIGALASRLGAGADDVRIATAAAAMVSAATANGHVCIGLAALARHVARPIDAVRAALLASRVAAQADDDEPVPHVPLVIDCGDRLYLARYYAFERNLANALSERAQTPDENELVDDPCSLRDIVGRYFGDAPHNGIDWQRVAAAVALTGRLTIISGGPGTGKTTTVAGVLACLLDAQPALRIALAAPTGKAAQRMQEALAARASHLPLNIAARLPTTAYTLHRLLGSTLDAGVRHHRRNPLPYDVIVVDEASMIDVALASRLVDAVAPRARLILLGDKDQLAAVEAGAVFAELGAHPCYAGERAQRIAQALGCGADTLRDALNEAGHIAQPGEAFAAAPGSGRADALRTTQAAMPVQQTLAPIQPDLFAMLDLSTDAHRLTGPDAAAGDPFIAGIDDGVPRSADDSPPALANCVVWLQENYRFGLGSPVGRLSTAIRDGLASDALSVLDACDGDAPVRFIDDAGPVLCGQSRDYIARGFAGYAKLLADTLRQREPDVGPLFDALNAFRVLCAVRAGAHGVDALNEWISVEVRRLARLPRLPGTRWFAGRPIIVTRNDYALGLFNGDIGIALPGSDGSLRVVFEHGAGSCRAVSPAMLPSHDTAFALTVHKSQGSEFEEVALVLPATFCRALSRELVYTAVTRARKRVAILGTRAVFTQAICTPACRDTGLSERLRHAAARTGAAGCRRAAACREPA